MPASPDRRERANEFLIIVRVHRLSIPGENAIAQLFVLDAQIDIRGWPTTSILGVLQWNSRYWE
jgi:hypothetical protein